MSIDLDKTVLIENAETIYEGDYPVAIKLKIKDQEEPVVIQYEDLYSSLEEDKIEEIAKSYPYPTTWQECEEIARLLNPNYMNISEKFYCVIQDLEDYIQCNHLENDEKLNWIVQQLDEIKEQHENARNNTLTNNQCS